MAGIVVWPYLSVNLPESPVRRDGPVWTSAL